MSWDIADYSSDESDNGYKRPRELATIDEMPSTIQTVKTEPPIDVTYESGLDLISNMLVLYKLDYESIVFTSCVKFILCMKILCSLYNCGQICLFVNVFVLGYRTFHDMHF